MIMHRSTNGSISSSNAGSGTVSPRWSSRRRRRSCAGSPWTRCLTMWCHTSVLYSTEFATAGRRRLSRSASELAFLIGNGLGFEPFEQHRFDREGEEMIAQRIVVPYVVAVAIAAGVQPEVRGVLNVRRERVDIWNVVFGEIVQDNLIGPAAAVERHSHVLAAVAEEYEQLPVAGDQIFADQAERVDRRPQAVVVEQ